VGPKAPTPVAFSLRRKGEIMYLCYLDESGTPGIPGNTSHYILAGVSIPVWHWRHCDLEINKLKAKYSLQDTEIHVAWMLRFLLEQTKVQDFEKLNYKQRTYEVNKVRNAELLRLQRSGKSKRYKQTKKNYRKTEAYIHLTQDERRNCVFELAECISQWGYARLFAECVDKLHFDPSRTDQTIDEQSFEQVVSRFEQYLEVTKPADDQRNYGLLIHDNNETVARRHTDLMRKFHRKGTLWTTVRNIIETPLFVDSELTGMVQVADLCAYSLRRYLENGEEDLFKLVFERADRKDDVVVGIRHFSDNSCTCIICKAHNKNQI
jgi:hypothetical protein